VIGGIRERLFGAASGVTWFILSFYVPVIIVSLGLLVWQLYTRRGEALTSSARTKELSQTRREIVGLSPKRNEAESAAADIDRAATREQSPRESWPRAASEGTEDRGRIRS